MVDINFVRDLPPPKKKKKKKKSTFHWSSSPPPPPPPPTFRADVICERSLAKGRMDRKQNRARPIEKMTRSMAQWVRNTENNKGKRDVEVYYRQCHKAWHHIIVGQTLMDHRIRKALFMVASFLFDLCDCQVLLLFPACTVWNHAKNAMSWFHNIIYILEPANLVCVRVQQRYSLG